MRFFGAFVLGAPVLSIAAPFVVSDPYPAQAAQPSEFVVTFRGDPKTVVVPAVRDGNGLIYFKMDMVGLSGPKTMTVVARNDKLTSVPSAPFYFYAWIGQDTRKYYKGPPITYRLVNGKWVEGQP